MDDKKNQPKRPDVELPSVLDLLFGELAKQKDSSVEKLADGVYKVDKGWL